MSQDTPDIINHYELPSTCCCECEFSTPSPPPPFKDDPPSYREATGSSSSSGGNSGSSDQCSSDGSICEDAQSQSDVRSIITPPPVPVSGRPEAKKLSLTLVPGLKQCLPYTTFKNEANPDDPEEAHSLFVQRWIDTVAGVDLILFAVSIILAFTTEKYLCYDGPIRLDFEEVLNQTLTSEVDDITEKLTVYEYIKDIVLKELMIDSPVIYHIVVISLLALGMSYFVLEIWLFCVLIKIGRSRRVSFCLKWICWRSLVLSLTVLISLFDMLHAHQATCAEVIFGPFQIVRLFIGGIPVIWVIWNSLGSGTIKRTRVR